VEYGRVVGRAVAAIVLAAVLGACRQDMHQAPRYDPLEASEMFAGGAASQALVAGTVARGFENADELLATGKVGGVESDLAHPAKREVDAAQGRYLLQSRACRHGSHDGCQQQRGADGSGRH
jgi:hypothetical protein